MNDKTLLFFKPVIYRNNIPTTIHLSDLLDSLRVKLPEARLINVNRKPTSMLRLKVLDSTENNPLDRGFCVAIYRDDRPFTGSRRTTAINEIRDDVLELTNCTYFSAYRILSMEYKHHGPRYKTIESYFNQFLPASPNIEWEIRFHQIEMNDELQDLRRSRNIKLVKFVLDLEATPLATTAALGALDADNETHAVFNQLVDANREAHNTFGGGAGEIIFKKSSTATPIHFLSILDIIENINIDSGLFKSVIIKYRPLESRKDKQINLIQAGYLKHSYQSDITAWEGSCDEINNIFFREGRIGANKPSSAPPLNRLQEVEELEIP